jgi:hypothetical protein
MDDYIRSPFDVFRKRTAPAREPATEYALEGFTPGEFADLLRIKNAYVAGGYSETTQEFKRLLFARWLVTHGRLHG